MIEYYTLWNKLYVILNKYNNIIQYIILYYVSIYTYNSDTHRKIASCLRKVQN